MFFAQDDKRSFKRMVLDIPVTITKDTLTVDGVCKDLSSTGMSLTFTDTNLQTGDVVHIQLATEHERFPPLDVDATLLRIDDAEQGFIAAVEFISVT